jgi:hypothetical protein
MPGAVNKDSISQSVSARIYVEERFWVKCSQREHRVFGQLPGFCSQDSWSHTPRSLRSSHSVIEHCSKTLTNMSREGVRCGWGGMNQSCLLST